MRRKITVQSYVLFLSDARNYTVLYLLLESSQKLYNIKIYYTNLKKKKKLVCTFYIYYRDLRCDFKGTVCVFNVQKDFLKAAF